MVESIIGYTAAVCTTVAFVPQAVKVLRTGDTQSLSLQTFCLFTLGVLLWFIYGIIIEDTIVMLANAVTEVLAVTILAVKIRNVMQGKDRPGASEPAPNHQGRPQP